MHFFGSFEKRNAKYHYCILPEIKEVAKNCEINLLKKKYDKIFTNIEDNIDNKKVFFINLPQSNKCKKIFLKKKKYSVYLQIIKVLIVIRNIQGT